LNYKWDPEKGALAASAEERVLADVSPPEVRADPVAMALDPA
jgi:hypothetical protein